jgi:uncharacterized membrane protein
MTATVAAPTGDQFGVLLAIFLVITFATVVVLWVHERRWDRHEAEIAVHHEQLATLAGRIQSLADHLGVDVHDARDDSPQALAMEEDDVKPDEMPTGPIEIAPDTVPDGMPLAVQSALIERRPSPAPRELMSLETAETQRANRAAFVEEQLARFDFSGRSK